MLAKEVDMLMIWKGLCNGPVETAGYRFWHLITVPLYGQIFTKNNQIRDGALIN